MRMRHLSVVLLAVAMAFGLSACKSSSSPDPAKPAGNQPAANKPAGGQPAGGQPAAGDLTDAEKQAMAEVKKAAADMQAKVASAETKLAAKQNAGALEDLAAANGLYEGVKGKLRPEMASKYVPELAATYAKVNALTQTARLEQGKEAGGGDASSDLMRQNENVRRQQFTVKATNAFKAGDEALKAKKYEEAIRQFEIAIETIRWSPYGLNLEKMEQESQAKLQQAKREFAAYKVQIEEKRLRDILDAERAAIEKLTRQRQEKIARLFRLAMASFEREDFGKAEELANEILREDPMNKAARRLHEDAVESRHEKARLEYVREKVERWRQFRNDMLETRTPFADLLKFPDAAMWERVKRRESAGDAASFALEETDDVKKIRSQLDTKRLTLDFTDTPFDDVVQFIQNVTQVNIVVDQTAKNKLAEGGGNVTLNVKDIRLKDALSLLLQVNGLSYTFKEGVLFITTPDSEASKGLSVAKIHDIRDLTAKINDFKGPNIRLQSTSSSGSGGVGGAIFDTGEEAEPAITKDALIELIKESVAPSTWEDEKNSLASIGGQLLVVNTPEVHASINSFLNDLREFSGLMVNVETRFVEVTDDFLQDIGVEWRGLGLNDGSNVAQPFGTPLGTTTVTSFFDNTSTTTGGAAFPAAAQATQTLPFAGFFSRNSFFGTEGQIRSRTQFFNPKLGFRQTPTGGLSLQYSILRDNQLNMILTAVRKSTEANVVSAPRITVFNTQRAYVSIVNQISYVKDYDVEIATNSVAADPEIGTVQDGLVLDVRPTVSHDRRYVTLEMRPTISFIAQPIRTRDITLGGTTNVSVRIQLPDITLHSAETTIRVPDQGAVVIGGLKTALIQDLRSEVPILGKIPLISFFFSKKGKSEEMRSLVIIAKATIIDLAEQEEAQRGRDINNNSR